VRGGAASGNRTPDLLITRRPYPAPYGLYQRQQLQISHLWVHQRHDATGVRATFDTTPAKEEIGMGEAIQRAALMHPSMATAAPIPGATVPLRRRSRGHRDVLRMQMASRARVALAGISADEQAPLATRWICFGVKTPPTVSRTSRASTSSPWALRIALSARVAGLVCDSPDHCTASARVTT
jgi:hypothetical protein